MMKYIPETELQAICESFAGKCALYISVPSAGEVFTYQADASIKAASTIKIPLLALLMKDAEEGRVDLDAYFREQAGYAGLLKTWITAISPWDKLMYGTDWPIVNLGEYIGFIKGLVPEQHWEKIFFDNANRIYGLGL